MSEDGIPVYACSRSDMESEKALPIGHANSAREAARMMRRFLSERDGANYDDLTGRTIFYSKNLTAYFTEE